MPMADRAAVPTDFDAPTRFASSRGEISSRTRPPSPYHRGDLQVAMDGRTLAAAHVDVVDVKRGLGRADPGERLLERGVDHHDVPHGRAAQAPDGGVEERLRRRVDRLDPVLLVEEEGRERQRGPERRVLAHATALLPERLAQQREDPGRVGLRQDGPTQGRVDARAVHVPAEVLARDPHAVLRAVERQDGLVMLCDHEIPGRARARGARAPTRRPRPRPAARAPPARRARSSRRPPPRPRARRGRRPHRARPR